MGVCNGQFSLSVDTLIPIVAHPSVSITLTSVAGSHFKTTLAGVPASKCCIPLTVAIKPLFSSRQLHKLFRTRQQDMQSQILSSSRTALWIQTRSNGPPPVLECDKAPWRHRLRLWIHRLQHFCKFCPPYCGNAWQTFKMKPASIHLSTLPKRTQHYPPDARHGVSVCITSSPTTH